MPMWLRLPSRTSIPPAPVALARGCAFDHEVRYAPAASRGRLSSPHSTHGFTILEVMVTLALIAILAAIAAPAMIDFVRNNKMSTAARQLDADMTLARREAIKRNTRVLICPKGSVAGKCATVTASAWAQGWLVCYDADFDGDCDDTADSNPNPIRQHAALELTLTLTGRRRALQRERVAGRRRRRQLDLHDAGHLDGLEIVCRDHHGDRQYFYRTGELR